MSIEGVERHPDHSVLVERWSVKLGNGLLRMAHFTMSFDHLKSRIVLPAKLRTRLQCASPLQTGALNSYLFPERPNALAPC